MYPNTRFPSVHEHVQRLWRGANLHRAVIYSIMLLVKRFDIAELAVVVRFLENLGWGIVLVFRLVKDITQFINNVGSPVHFLKGACSGRGEVIFQRLVDWTSCVRTDAEQGLGCWMFRRHTFHEKPSE